MILVGLPAAGKTTFYQRHFAATHRHVSKDLSPNAAGREARQRRLMAEILAEGASLVVDNTNPTIADRAAIMTIARAHGARVIGYFFDVTTRQAVARNAERTGRQKVPNVDRSVYASASGLHKGAYILKEAEGGAPEIILIATGSEVQLIVAAQKMLAERGTRARIKAWMIRYGVQGSALPGLSTSGIFKGTEGIQSECTPGELLGSTTPRDSVRGKKLNACPPTAPNPRSNVCQSIFLVRPLSTFPASASTPQSLPIFFRANTCGIPVVAET